MPTGLSRLIPRITRLLTKSTLSPVQEITTSAACQQRISQVSHHPDPVCNQYGPSRFARSKKESNLKLFKVTISDHRIIDNLSRYAIAWLRAIHTSRADLMPVPLQSYDSMAHLIHAKIQRFPCMRSCPWDFFIHQTRAVCAELLTSGVAISDSSLATAAANAVAGFRTLQTEWSD